MPFRIFKKKNARRVPSPFLDVGFHGDLYLLELVDSLIRDRDYFVETGANVGSTLAYVARTYPHIKCFSCEPDRNAFEEAVKNTKGLPNVLLYNKTSEDFINLIKTDKKDLFKRKTLFWLDAHGYGFEWPLKDEFFFITSNFRDAYILIDDFNVPGLDCFAYDIYQDQICSLDFVKDSLSPKHSYRIYYPNYTEKTSPHHPLTGWGLIEFGHEGRVELPEGLKEKIRGPLDV